MHYPVTKVKRLSKIIAEICRHGKQHFTTSTLAESLLSSDHSLEIMTNYGISDKSKASMHSMICMLTNDLKRMHKKGLLDRDKMRRWVQTKTGKKCKRGYEFAYSLTDKGLEAAGIKPVASNLDWIHNDIVMLGSGYMKRIEAPDCMIIATTSGMHFLLEFKSNADFYGFRKDGSGLHNFDTRDLSQTRVTRRHRKSRSLLKPQWQPGSSCEHQEKGSLDDFFGSQEIS